jgi:hypothetical protein
MNPLCFHNDKPELPPMSSDSHGYLAAWADSNRIRQSRTEKVMTKIRLTLTQQEMEDCANCVPFAMEKIMLKLQVRVPTDE